MWLLNCMSTTQFGCTPLVDAAYYGECDVVTELLDNGADVNAQTNVSPVIVYKNFIPHLNNFKSVVTFGAVEWLDYWAKPERAPPTAINRLCCLVYTCIYIWYVVHPHACVKSTWSKVDESTKPYGKIRRKEWSKEKRARERTSRFWKHWRKRGMMSQAKSIG